MSLSKAQIDLKITDNILTGGSRTRAVGVREVLNDITGSYLNIKDGGLVIEALTGYSSLLVPSDPKHFTNKKYVDDAIAGIDLSTLWNKGGNTLTTRGKLGSTSGNFGVSIVKEDITIGGWGNDGSFFWGTNTKFADTDHSFGGTYNTIAGYVWQAQNSGNTQRAWFRGDGLFSATGGLSTDGVLSIKMDTVNRRYLLGDTFGYPTSGFSLSVHGFNALNNNSGDYVTAFNNGAGVNNSGSNVNLLGNGAGNGNSGSYINAFLENAGINNTGSHGNLFGAGAGFWQSGSYVNLFGYQAGAENTRSNLFAVSNITDIFWNNIGDKGYTTLQAVTQQTAMSADGTNTSASASVFKIAQARGTGNAAQGNIIFQKANIQVSGTTRHTLTDWWFFDLYGNTGFGGQSYGAGVGIIFISIATTIPSADPVGGFQFYQDPADNGVKIRIGSTITTVATP